MKNLREAFHFCGKIANCLPVICAPVTIFAKIYSFMCGIHIIKMYLIQNLTQIRAISKHPSSVW